MVGGLEIISATEMSGVEGLIVIGAAEGNDKMGAAERLQVIGAPNVDDKMNCYKVDDL